MKIIRHGYFGYAAYICGNCGCVFDIEEPDDNDLTLTELKKILYPECPDCGFECTKHRVLRRSENETSA